MTGTEYDAVDRAATEPEIGACPGCGQSLDAEHKDDCSIAYADTPSADLVHPQGKRRMFYVDDTMYTPNGFVPALVTEDEPGFSPMIGQGELAQPWYWGHDLDEAKRIAAKSNAERGISEDDAHDILISSIVASNKLQAASERWEAIKQGRG